MKNPREFSTLTTLTESERKRIKECVNSICDAHENDDWAQMYGKIIRMVEHELLCRLANEKLEELMKEEEDE